MRDRGDRLRPPATHHARRVLAQLASAARRAADSLPPGEGRRLLDFGCGNVPYRPFFVARGWEYVGADLPGNPDATLDLAPDGSLPAHAGSFGAACSFQVLEHVPDPRTYLRQLHGALTPGAPLVLSTHGVWPYHPDPTDYWRWTRDGLVRELARAGFELLREEAILGPVAAGFQLTASQIHFALPPRLSLLACLAMNPVVAAVDALEGPSRRGHDASVYVITARRGAGGRES